ncbi:MAG TPA: hypothetical protein VIN57_06780 [Magnetovibrio sp.]
MSKINFTLLVGIVGGGLAALAPNFYETGIAKFESSNVVFRYEEKLASDSAWRKILEKTIGVLVTTDDLLNSYRTEVETRFEEKKYTVERVMREDRVLVPFELANKKLNEIYDPLFRVANAQRLIEFIIENNSSNGLEIDSITISTGVVVQEPLFVAVPSFPYKGNCSMESATGDYGGIIVTCKDENKKSIIMPKNSKLRLVMTQPTFPFVREDTTFMRASFVNGGGNQEDYYLVAKDHKEGKKDNSLLDSMLSLLFASLGLSMVVAPLNRRWRAYKATKKENDEND